MKTTFVSASLTLFLAASALGDPPPTPVMIQSDTCGKKMIASPLGHNPETFSDFNPAHDHYGVDFVSKDEPVLAVAPGVVKTIDWNVKTLNTPNARSGLKIRGWGRYVVVHHDDGTESLYAHLDKESTKSLKVGQVVKTGDALGKSDTSGGATGPHLHFEYSPTGKIYNNPSKVDPDPCILRQDWLTLESYSLSASGVGQLYIGDQLIGENVLHQKTKFWVRLKPGQYSVRVFAKQIASSSPAYFSVDMGDSLSILNSEGDDLGPGFAEELHQGQATTQILSVE